MQLPSIWTQDGMLRCIHHPEHDFFLHRSMRGLAGHAFAYHVQVQAAESGCDIVLVRRSVQGSALGSDYGNRTHDIGQSQQQTSDAGTAFV